MVVREERRLDRALPDAEVNRADEFAFLAHVDPAQPVIVDGRQREFMALDDRRPCVRGPGQHRD